MREICFSVQLDVFTTLLLARSGNAAVHHSKIIQVEIRSLAGPHPKIVVQRPSPAGKIFCAYRVVHAAIDGPVERIPKDSSLARGCSKGGDQKSALAAQLFDRRRSEWQIDNRNAFDAENSVVNPG